MSELSGFEMDEMIRASMIPKAAISARRKKVYTGGNLFRCKIADSSGKLPQLYRSLHRTL